MDLQYVPAVLTPANKDKALAMVEAISQLARDAGVNVLRRFAFMKGLYQVEQVSFDRMVDPNDDDRLHDSDWADGACGGGGEARDRRRRQKGMVIGNREHQLGACYSYVAALRSNPPQSSALKKP
jgi:hypothetical protein